MTQEQRDEAVAALDLALFATWSGDTEETARALLDWFVLPDNREHAEARQALVEYLLDPASRDVLSSRPPEGTTQSTG